jgi:regulator of sigma E protease
MLWTIGSVAVGLGLVIFVHELGHFLAAKACGIKCEKFYVGFDIPIRLGPIKLPSALAKFRWGETEYGVGILPLGGYVKMLGQDDDPRKLAEENERIKVQKQAESNAQPSADAEAFTVEQSDGANAGSASSPNASSGVGDEQAEFELDPRSFPAKPVWQRMIVISAGVIMNLIFAVVFAAVAYRMGVSYTPCILGGTAPGDPAWVEGIQPGDKIIQIGRKGWFGRRRVPDEQLRFDKDLMINVTLNGAEREMELLIRGYGQSEAEWISLMPTDRLKDFERPATLGVRPTSTTRLSSVKPCDPYFADKEGYSHLRGGDEIVAVEGRSLTRDEDTGAIFEHHLEKELASRMAEPVRLTVRRRPGKDDEQGKDASATAPKEDDIILPANIQRTVGLIMDVGPIVGVRKGSPAARAGFQAGDVLEKVDGQPVGDPFTLAQRLLPLLGKEVEFVVEGAEEPMTATLEPPATYVDNFGPGSPVSLECLGIAFDVRNVVKEVVPGSPAYKTGLRTGDKVVDVQFVLDGEKSGDPITLVSQGPDDEEIDLPNWAHVHALMNILEDSTLKITYRRGDVDKQVALNPVEYRCRRGDAGKLVALSSVDAHADTDVLYYYPSRGLSTTSLSRVRTADSWPEAWSLGYVETETSLKQVLVILQRLFTGQISYKSMGGPIMIARAAGAEASHGVPRLLVFLTFLSANLAVLNFLPIPALDGGHMVFLAAEWVRGKPVNERLQVVLTLIGVGCLLSLMVLVFALDIHRLPIFH